jgi:hypothetical protein
MTGTLTAEVGVPSDLTARLVQAAASLGTATTPRALVEAACAAGRAAT